MTALANVSQLHPATPRTTFRLTRRGRTVFGALATLLVAGALAVAATVGATGAVASNATNPEAFPYVLAQPGDSLWSIATELDPAMDSRDLVREIARLNQMSDADLQAGETFAVPLRYADAARTFPGSELEA